MSKKFITKTKDGFDIYVDTELSHAATHLKTHPELFDLIKEILSKSDLPKDLNRFETDMGRVVGKMTLVETDEDDDIFYAKRPNREKYTRFVRGREEKETTFVTMKLIKKSSTEYEVFTAFIGRLTPPFPYGKEDKNKENREFWKNHALVAENLEFLPETVTTECPW